MRTCTSRMNGKSCSLKRRESNPGRAVQRQGLVEHPNICICPPRTAIKSGASKGIGAALAWRPRAHPKRGASESAYILLAALAARLGLLPCAMCDARASSFYGLGLTHFASAVIYPLVYRVSHPSLGQALACAVLIVPPTAPTRYKKLLFVYETRSKATSPHDYWALKHKAGLFGRIIF